MVDVLCGVLSGSATGLNIYADEKRPDVGHFFMVIDPAAFRPLDEFKQEMDRLARELKDSPKAQGNHGYTSTARKAMREWNDTGEKVSQLDPKSLRISRRSERSRECLAYLVSKPSRAIFE